MSSIENSNPSEINAHPIIDDKNTALENTEPLDSNESKLKSRLLFKIKKNSHKKGFMSKLHSNSYRDYLLILLFGYILSLLINLMDIYSLVKYTRKEIPFDSTRIKRAYLAKVIINLIDGLVNISYIVLTGYMPSFVEQHGEWMGGWLGPGAITPSPILNIILSVIPIILALIKIISGSIYLAFDKNKNNGFNKLITYIQTIVPSLFYITTFILESELLYFWYIKKKND